MSTYNYQFRCRPVITVLLLSSAFTSSGQHTAAFKVRTFRVIDRLYTLSYEQALNKHISAEISLEGGYYINVRPNKLEDYKVKGRGVIGALRYYPFTQKAVAPRGFFGYAAFRYVDFNETFLYTSSGDRYHVGGNILNVGVGMGYKFVYHRFGLEAIIGWGAGRLKSDDHNYRSNIPEFYREGIEEQTHFPQLDVSLCYLFSPVTSR